VATISIDGGVVTFINVFTCEPSNQQALIDTLVEETETTMRGLPGFLSANIHASEDGTRVCNYAQWTSMEAFQRLMSGDAGRQVIANVRRYATDADIHLYRVAQTFGAPVAAK